MGDKMFHATRKGKVLRQLGELTEKDGKRIFQPGEALVDLKTR